MLGNFSYCNPTRLHFGESALDKLQEELEGYGERVLLVYGGGSIKESGLYNEIIEILKKSQKLVSEIAEVMPNPTIEKVYEGCRVARGKDVDLILAVGGGSVCDYAKAVSVSAHCQEEPWGKYFVRMERVNNKIIPVGCIVTMVGTGSEMNGGSVITNPTTKLKVARIFDENAFPKFSILNPTYTFTVPAYQQEAGVYDIMNHITEQYFSGQDDNVSDYVMEGLLRSLIHSSKIAKKNPMDYEARSNMMWLATWALNTFVACGKTEDWIIHEIGQSIGAHTNATHGMTLSAISMPYYRHIMPYGVAKFKRFAMNVWDVTPEGKTDAEIAEEGLNCMEEYMKELGLIMHIKELGVSEDMLEAIANSTSIYPTDYKTLTREDVMQILRQSM